MGEILTDVTAMGAINKGASLYSSVVDAGSNFGRYMAERGMSSESAALAVEMGHVKEGARGDNLTDCGRKAAVSALTQQSLNAKVCSPDAAEVGMEIGRNALSKSVYGAVNASTGRALGMIFDAASTAIGTRQNHMDAIRLLSQKDFPGMSYKEHDVDGQKVKVWADALGAGLYPNDPKIKTYVDVSSPTGDSEAQVKFQSDNWKKIESLVAVTSSEALGSVQNYTATNGHDALKQKISEAPAEILQGYNAEREAIAAYRQSIRPTQAATNTQQSYPQ